MPPKIVFNIIDIRKKTPKLIVRIKEKNKYLLINRSKRIGYYNIFIDIIFFLIYGFIFAHIFLVF